MKISCIIPAYNEAGRIAKVLEAVSNHPLVAETIVVDDGSSDGTKDIVKTFPDIRLISHETNKGKSMALYTGINAAEGDTLLFLDADLISLTPKDITDLIEPVSNGIAKVSISLRNNTPWFWIAYGLDYLSGERVLSKEILLPYLEELPKITGYGIEVFMNRIIIKNNFPITVVFWKDVSFTYKMTKIGFVRGLAGEVKMSLDILRTISPVEMVYQVRTMKKLTVNLKK